MTGPRPRPLRILSLEDSKEDFEMLAYALRKEGLDCDITRVETQRAFEQHLTEGEFDIILSDYNLPGFEGTSALIFASEHRPAIPFLFVTGYLGEDVAIETLKKGATDYVLKDKLSRLGPAVRRALSEAEDREQRHRAEQALRVNEERYRLLVEQSTDLVAELDEELIFLYVGPNAMRFLGYSREELIGTSAVAYVVSDDAAHVRDAFQSRQVRISFRITRKGGKVLWLEAAIGSFSTSTGERRFFMDLRDITQEKEAEAALEQSRRELQQFSEHLDHLLEEERKRISREIHDELGQLLTGLKFDLSWITLHADGTTAEFRERTHSALETLESALTTVKRIARELRPPQLDALGICGAIQWDVLQFQKKYAIAASLQMEPEEFAVDAERSTVLYRVFNEALTNIARHAHASSVSVELRHLGSELVLQVRDDGKGFPKGHLEQSRSLGIVGMRERLRPLHGELLIESVPGKGTSVQVILPLHRQTSG